MVLIFVYCEYDKIIDIKRLLNNYQMAVRRLSDGYRLLSLLLLQFRKCNDINPIIINFFCYFLKCPCNFGLEITLCF